jgi:hypothetical protein
MNAKLTPLESVIECLTFPSAEAKYQALVAVGYDWSSMNDISSYTAPDEVSAIECRLFRIDESLLPALFWAHERYINLIGCVTEYFGEFVETERRQHPDYFRGERVWEYGLAVGFMVSVCKLPQPDCMGWVCKIIAAELRGGLYEAEIVACS